MGKISHLLAEAVHFRAVNAGQQLCQLLSGDKSTPPADQEKEVSLEFGPGASWGQELF